MINYITLAITIDIDTDIVCALGYDVNVFFTVGHGQSLKLQHYKGLNYCTPTPRPSSQVF